MVSIVFHYFYHETSQTKRGEEREKKGDGEGRKMAETEGKIKAGNRWPLSNVNYLTL